MNQSLALSLLKSGRNVFLTGQAGAGKTYVINQYIQWLRSCDVPVAITASTGIAATHIGGVTIHSRSGIGIKDRLTDHDMELIQQKEHLHKNITKAKVLIIDEISMISATTLDMVDRVVQMIRRDGRPFGGLQVILVGDFFQLPPVISSQDANNTKRFAFAAKAWKELNLAICYLHTQHRQDEGDFSIVLNELRKGQASQESIALLRTRMDSEITHTNPVKLYTHNIDVDRINDEKLEELTGEEKSYIATWAWDKKLIDTIKKSMLAPEVLYLKAGAQVLFVKNNPGKGYYNGTTGEVVGFVAWSGYPLVKIANGDVITAEPEKRSVENANEIIVSVTQIPLKLARAITVHKSQGMTLDAAEMDLSKVFEPGQGYVALSRVKALESLKLLGLNESGLNAHPLVARGDDYFWNQSEILVDEYSARTDDIWDELHAHFVELVGGIYTKDITEKSKVMLSDYTYKAKANPKWLKAVKDTYATTLFYITRQMPIADIAKIRELTPGTIRSHIFKLHEQDPTLDIAYLKPESSLLNLVQSAYTKAKQQSKQDISSKDIFTLLNSTVSYEDIKKCLLFIE